MSDMKNFFHTYGTLAADLGGILLGILFLTMRPISWVIVTVLLLLLCLYEPIVSRISTHKGLRTNDSVDLALNCLAFAVGIPLLFSQGKYMYNIFFLVGVWMLAAAFLSAINCYVIARDRQAHFLRQFLYTIYAGLLGLFLILGASFSLKRWILSLLAGIFFTAYSLRAFLADYTRFFPDSWIARHRTWSLSLPLLFSAFVPMRAWVIIQQADQLPKDTTPADLYVYVYCKGSGFERFGHIDIAYKGLIYSYGCHDPQNRTLGGTLGDGVLIVIDQKKFLQNAAESEDKTIIQYGLRLNEKQKEIYGAVLEAQTEALNGLHAGMTGREADAIARNVITKAGYGSYFGHALGHSVGLYIHEKPTLSPADHTVLEPGMVETVEPGIYIPGFGGVRIEDMVIITENGIRNLTSSPKELIEL